jgi:hypothetical protein
MSDYTKLVDYATKDALASGNPSKVIKGVEIDAEFEALETAVASKVNTTDNTTALALKANLAGAAFTGAVTNTSTITADGLIYGRGASSNNGLGKITVSTSAPSVMAAGDLWFMYV